MANEFKELPIADTHSVVLEERLVDINRIVGITDFKIHNPVLNMDDSEDMTTKPSGINIYAEYRLKSYYNNDTNLDFSFILNKKDFKSINQLKLSRVYQDILYKIDNHRKTYDRFKEYWEKNSVKFGLNLKRFVTDDQIEKSIEPVYVDNVGKYTSQNGIIKKEHTKVFIDHFIDKFAKKHGMIGSDLNIFDRIKNNENLVLASLPIFKYDGKTYGIDNKFLSLEQIQNLLREKTYTVVIYYSENYEYNIRKSVIDGRLYMNCVVIGNDI